MAAAMYTLIGTARLKDVDPQARLADVLARIAETPQTRLEELSGIVAVAHLFTVIVTNDTGDAGPSGATNVGGDTGAP